jgi:hypothetical protein
MSKHTKGPWVADGTRVYIGENPKDVGQAADARLIAASPELLNLAKQIVPMIRSGQYAILCDLAELVIEQAEEGTAKRK